MLRFNAQEMRRPSRSYLNMSCETCNILVCSHCEEHSNHQLVDIKEAYVTKRQVYKEHIQKIRSETFYNIHFFLEKLRNDVKADICNCRNEIISCQPGIKRKAGTLKTLLNGLKNVCIDVIKCKHSCLIQKNKMVRFMARMQIYE